jgi:predicted transposase YbfD/YdcC
MCETASNDFLSLFKLHFGSIVDTRVGGRTSYSLDEILFLCLTATLSGMETWDEIELFGETRLSWLQKYFPYANGSPSHDTLNRVMSLIKPEFFQKAFIGWVHAFFNLDDKILAEHIAIDGKSIRRSVTKKSRQTSKINGGSNGAFLVNAWSITRGICVAQYDITEKNSEPDGGLKILQQLDIQGYTISGDANFCQKKIAEHIIAEQANYVFSLKGNKTALHAEVVEAFKEGGTIVSTHEHHDKGHGRVEQRNVEVMAAFEVLSDERYSEWKGLQTLTKVHTRRFTISTGKTEVDVRYYISSLPIDTDAAKLGKIIRDHWQIENNLHWSLDVIFGEDKSTKREINAAINLSVLKKMALSILKNTNDKKMSVKRKLKKAAMSPKYTENVLGI